MSFINLKHRSEKTTRAQANNTNQPSEQSRHNSTEQADKTDAASHPVAQLKNTLLKRMALASGLILALLGSLALFDHLGTPEESANNAPRFTSAVPVSKKESAQATPQPAEPTPITNTSAEEPTKTEAESSASAQPQPSSSEKLPPPEIRAQPSLPITPAAAPKSNTSNTPSASNTASAPKTAKNNTAASEEVTRAPENNIVPASKHSTNNPPSPTKPQTSALGRYLLQVGVFSETQRAEALQAQLSLNGITSTLETRVQVGPFKTRQEAETAQRKMKSLGLDALLLAPKNKLKH